MNDPVQILSSEAIEAIPREDVLSIQTVAKTLHSAIKEDLSLLSSGDAKERKELREKMQIKLREAKAYVSQEIANLQALKTELGILTKYTESDFWAIHDLVKNLESKERSMGNAPNYPYSKIS